MRSDDPHATLTSSRQSRSYYTDIDEKPLRTHLHRHQRSGFGLYASMLEEDLAQHLLPYGRGIDEGFTVVLTSPDPHSADLVRNAMPARYWPARTLEDGIRDFMSDGVQRVLADSSAVYELAYLRPTAKPDSVPVAFRLHPLLPGSLGNLDGNPIQYVPAAAAPDTVVNRLHYVRLDPDHLLTINLDPATRRTLDVARRLLVAADNAQGTPLRMLEQNQRSKTGFDVSAYKKAVNRELLSGTRSLGWTGRGLFSDGMLDPYVVWRHLQFARFKITIRDILLAALNEALARAGAEIGFNTTLVLDGVLTCSDLDKAEADLQSGNTPLTELVKLT